MGKPKKHIYQIAVTCTPEQEQRVKTFCRFTNQTAADFAALAMCNEIDAQLAKMPEDKRKVIETLLKE